MKTTNSILLFLILFLSFIGINKIFAVSLPVAIEGNYLIRLPGSGRYIQKNLPKLPDNTIISIPLENASNSLLILDSHNIKLYPGAVFKISKGSFIPMAGRFEFSSEEKTATSTINIVANNCNAGYRYGHFLVEVTPDNGIFFAMKNKGLAWVKDIYRKVFELKQGQQVHIPLFGQSKLRNTIEAFWGKEPSSFGHLGEVGQETAYGIVGKGTPPVKLKNSHDDEDEEGSDEVLEETE